MRIAHSFSVWLVITCFLTLAGCANNQQSTASTNTDSSAKRYESQDLNKTGKRTAGEALQAADPAVTARGGH